MSDILLPLFILLEGDLNFNLMGLKLWLSWVKQYGDGTYKKFEKKNVMLYDKQ